MFCLTLEAYLEAFPSNTMREEDLPPDYTYIRSSEFQPFMVRPEEDILIPVEELDVTANYKEFLV